MSRLGPLDKALLGTLLPIWLFCFALHLRVVAETGYAIPPVFASPGAGADDYPRVGGWRPETYVSATGLEVGDRLLRAGEADLRGVGFIGFWAVVLEQAGPDLRVPIEFERAGRRAKVELALSRAPLPWVRVPGLVAIAVTAVLVLLRAPQRGQARRFFAAFMSLLILETPFDGPSPWQVYLSQTIFCLTGGLAAALVLRWALLFPDELSRPARIAPAWAWVAAPLWYAGRVNWLLGAPLPPAWLPAVTLGLDSLLGAAFLGILTANYLRAEPIGRRRIKWVLYGAYVLTICLWLTVVTGFLSPHSPWLDEMYWIAAVALPIFPLATLIAVVRYNLFDIDRLISATLSYNIVLVGLIGLALGVVPGISRVVATAAGIDASAGQLILSLLLAVAVLPAHRMLRPRIDQILFADRYRLEEGIEGLIVELSACEEPRALLQLLGERLDQLLRPEVAVVYARSEASFVPVFVQGRTAAEVYDVEDPLIAALRRHKTPLTLERFATRRRRTELSRFDRVALETLGVPLVVPLRAGGDFVAFICLGSKRSGDVYTSTDVTLLVAVAEKASAELSRHAAAPGAVTPRAGGAPFTSLEGPARSTEDPGATIGVILFTDLVGSTHLMQRVGEERAQRIVQAHHRLLTAAVRDAHGVELEWVGDGMIAGFASAANAVRCAIAMQQAAAQPLEGERMEMRLGLSVGEMLRQSTGSGYFGLAVVTAKRLCDRAEAGQILCNSSLAALLAGRPDFRFRDLGHWELKAVAAPVGVCEVLY